MAAWQTDNIVCTWLNFLQVGEYTNRFLDNGYDDLETVKQIGTEDLRAIGVDNQEDEEVILLSVKVLREQGGAWVYLLAGEQDMMSSSDQQSSSSSLDTFRARLRHTETSQESIEPLGLCDDIYCDISEEISCQQESGWSDFWRRLAGGSKNKTKLKKGEQEFL